MDVDERKPAANPTTVNNTATNSSNNSNEGNESNGLLGNNGHVGPTAADNFHVNGDLPVDIGVSDANMNNYSAATMDDNATLTTASSSISTRFSSCNFNNVMEHRRKDQCTHSKVPKATNIFKSGGGEENIC